MTAIVGAIALGVWYVHFAIEEVLSSPHTFGDVTITPYGHRQNNLLDHFYDSILVEKGPSKYMIRGPLLDITPFGDDRGIILDVKEVSANQVLDSAASETEKDSSKIEPIEFPDNVRIPFPVKVNIGKIDFKMGDMDWKAENIQVQNIGPKCISPPSL